jgi:toxin secretion/phage lysis holin
MKLKDLQLAVAAIGGAIGWFLGGFDGMLYALIAFSAADYISGVASAVIRREVSSKIGAKGILRKVLIFTLVGIAHMIDRSLLVGGGAIRTSVILFYLSNEGVSLLENAAEIGLPVPDKLKNILAGLKNH